MKPNLKSKFSNLSWVFGYGSLMWDPGFSYTEQEPARLEGFHRAFCIYSHHHRGTRDHPGLVLGLDEGGFCLGIAFKVLNSEWLSTIDYLNNRELKGNYAYLPAVVNVELSSNIISAYTFIANPKHQNYAGKLSLDSTVEIIRNAEGIGGRNYDYLIEVTQKLRALGCPDKTLIALLKEINAEAEK